jgi:hypothetical protein
MTALTVIGVICLVLIALLALKASIVIKCHDIVELYVKVLFIKIKLLPKKKLDYRDYSLKKLERKKKKEEKKALKQERKKQEKQKEKTNGTQTQTKKKKPDILTNLSLITDLVKIFLKKFSAHLHIDVSKMIINVKTDDPAKTGVLYGAVCASVSQLLELLDRATNLKKKAKSEIAVNADFLSGKTTCDIDICFSIRVWGLLDIGISLAYNYIKDLLKKKNYSNKQSSVENGGNKNG